MREKSFFFFGNDYLVNSLEFSFSVMWQRNNLPLVVPQGDSQSGAGCFQINKTNPMRFIVPQTLSYVIMPHHTLGGLERRIHCSSHNRVTDSFVRRGGQQTKLHTNPVRTHTSKHKHYRTRQQTIYTSNTARYFSPQHHLEIIKSKMFLEIKSLCDKKR